MEDRLNVKNTAIRCKNFEEYKKALDLLESSGYIFNIQKKIFLDSKTELNLLIDKNAVLRFRLGESYFKEESIYSILSKYSCEADFNESIRIKTFDEIFLVHKKLEDIRDFLDKEW